MCQNFLFCFLNFVFCFLNLCIFSFWWIWCMFSFLCMFGVCTHTCIWYNEGFWEFEYENCKKNCILHIALLRTCLSFHLTYILSVYASDNIFHMSYWCRLSCYENQSNLVGIPKYWLLMRERNTSGILKFSSSNL